VKLIYFFLILICSSCVPNRAVIDSTAYAPVGSHLAWKPSLSTSLEDLPFEPQACLSLTDVLDIALNNSPYTHDSWAQTRKAAATYGESQSYLFPILSANYSLQQSRSPLLENRSKMATNPKSLPMVNLTQWGPKLQLSYLLYDFGKVSAHTTAAKNALYVANHSHNHVLQKVIQQVSDSFYSLLFQKELVKAAELDLDCAEKTYRAAALEQEAGLKDASELLQAQTLYLQSQMHLVEQKQSLKQAQATLQTAMGIEATKSLNFDSFPKAPPSDLMLENANEILKLAILKREDLKAAHANCKSLEASVLSAKTQFLPTLDYQFNYGQTNYSKIGHSKGDFASIISFSFPIFDGFATTNRLRISEAGYKQAKALVRKTELQVIEDVTISHQAATSSFEMLSYIAELLKNTEQQYEIALLRYKNHLTDILEVINAQKALSNARASQARTLKTWFSSMLNLNYAAGMLTMDEV
jgi:outer membrane protein